MQWVVLSGDARKILARVPERSVQMCMTSPPYFGLRSYDCPDLLWRGDPACSHSKWVPFIKPGISGGTGKASRKREYSRGKSKGEDNPNFQIVPDQEQAYCENCGCWSGQLGQEPTLEMYVDHLVDVYRAVHRVLKDDGTFWLNIADTWAGSGRGLNGDGTHGKTTEKQESNKGVLVRGISPSPVPDGMKAKDVMDVPGLVGDALRTDGWYWRSKIVWWKPGSFPEGGVYDRPFKSYEYVLLFSKKSRYFYDRNAVVEDAKDGGTKFLRDVWSINNETSTLPHFASFPTALAERCILLGSKPGDMVLDPMCGIGRAGKAALKNGRSFLGIDLGPGYVKMAREYIAKSVDVTTASTW